MFRLGQTYLVDMISRIIDYRLQFNKLAQHTLFGQPRHDFPGDENDELNDGDRNPDNLEGTPDADEPERTTFLSQSFHGSRRHLLSLARSAICLVAEFGRPTLFITFTCAIHMGQKSKKCCLKARQHTIARILRIRYSTQSLKGFYTT